MIGEKDKLNIKNAKLYLDGLMEYSSKVNPGYDDWVIPFLSSQIKFRTDLSLKCLEAHKYANNYVKENLNNYGNNEETYTISTYSLDDGWVLGRAYKRL